MQEYNWKKEREKYRAKLDETTPSVSPAAPAAPAATAGKTMAQQIIEADENRRQKRKMIAIWCCVAVVIAAIAATVIFFAVKKDDSAVKSGGKENAGETVADEKKASSGNEINDSAKALAAVAEKNKHAVGAVAVRYEVANGSIGVTSLGTAWAFAEDKFATNAHVAIGIRDESWLRAIYDLTEKLFVAEIIKSGFDNMQDYVDKIGKEKANEVYKACQKKAAGMVKKVDPVILINGESHKYFFIDSVAVHRDYRGENTNYTPDFAVLKIRGKHDSYFKLADKETLYNLKAGEPVAFMGFPTEDVQDINVDSPVAIMQVGNIVSVSGFDLKDAGPAGNQNIRHNLPATGGASGSPIFNTKGEIVAILWGGNSIVQGNGQRAPNAALINFGVRVDLLDGVGDAVEIEKFVKKIKL